MATMITRILGWTAFCGLVAVATMAPVRTWQGQDAKPSDPKATADVSAPKEETSTTDHTIQLGGQTIPYKATASTTLIKNEADDLRADHGCLVAAQHAFDVEARPHLIAEKVEDVADHSIADEEVGAVRVAGGDIGELLGQGEGCSELPLVEETGPSAPHGSELVIDVPQLL